MSPSPPIFAPAPAELSLEPGGVDVWNVPTNRSERSVEELWGLLDPEERRRAASFRFEVHRGRFVRRRARLREILASYVGEAPERLQFSASEYGKPVLANHPEFAFSASHSADVALVAVGEAGELGVDLERDLPLEDYGRLVQNFFSAAEQREYERLPLEVRRQGFYLTWTRKEAWLKAQGDGLFGDLTRFDVPVDPREPTRLLRVGDDPLEAGRWQLRSFVPERGYVAAVALRRTHLALRFWRG